MMNAGWLLTAALTTSLLQSYFNKKSSLTLRGGKEVSLFTAMKYTICVFMAAGVLLISPAARVASPMILLTSALGGVSLALCGVASFLALQRGAVVLVTMSATAGLLIPCLAGILFFGESFSLLQLAGLLLLGLAAWMLMNYSSRMSCKITWKTGLLLLLVLVSNGSTMLAQKLFSYCLPNEEVSVYSLWSFGFAALFLWSYLLFFQRDKRQSLPWPPKSTWLPMVFLALAVFVINQTITMVSALLPSVLLFPLFNGLGLILSTLMSAICFRERLTRLSVLGLLIGVAALICLNAGT